MDRSGISEEAAERRARSDRAVIVQAAYRGSSGWESDVAVPVGPRPSGG